MVNLNKKAKFLTETIFLYKNQQTFQKYKANQFFKILLIIYNKGLEAVKMLLKKHLSNKTKNLKDFKHFYKCHPRNLSHL